MTYKPLLPFILLASASACNDPPSDTPRIYDHGQNGKIEAPAVVQPRTSVNTRPAYVITDRLAESGGEIQISLEQGIVRSTYETEGNLLTSKIEGTIGVPLTILANERVLSITRLEIQNSDRLTLRVFENGELDELKSKARKGIRIAFTLSPDSRAATSEQVVYNSIPPLAASPDLFYVALPSRGEPTLDQLRALATATREYHLDLLKLVKHANTLKTSRLFTLTDAAYFSWEARDRMAQAAAGLTMRIDMFSQSLREAIIRNIKCADSLGPILNQIISEGIAKASDLTSEAGMKLLQRLYPSEFATEAIDRFSERFAPTDPSGRLQLLELAKSKLQDGVANRLAGEIFRLDSDGTPAALLKLISELPKSPSRDSLLIGALPLLGAVKNDELKVLLSSLQSETTMVRLAPRLIGKAAELTGSLLAELTRTLPLGAVRDAVLLSSLESLKSVTPAEARALLANVYAPATTRAVAQKLFSKIPSFNAGTLQEMLAGIYRGPLRDLIVADGTKALSVRP